VKCAEARANHLRAINTINLPIRISSASHRGTVLNGVSSANHRGTVLKGVSSANHRGSVLNGVSSANHRGSVLNGVSSANHPSAREVVGVAEPDASTHPLADQPILWLPAAVSLLEAAAAQDADAWDGQAPGIPPGNLAHRLAPGCRRPQTAPAQRHGDHALEAGALGSRHPPGLQDLICGCAGLRRQRGRWQHAMGSRPRSLRPPRRPGTRRFPAVLPCGFPTRGAPAGGRTVVERSLCGAP